MANTCCIEMEGNFYLIFCLFSIILHSTPAQIQQDPLCDAKLSDIWLLIGSSWAIYAFRSHKMKGNIIKIKKCG